MSATQYRVAKAMLTLRVPGDDFMGRGGGYVRMSFYQNNFVPAGAHPEDVERLVREGYLEAIPPAEAE